jgi:hypothetical protein
VRNICILIDFAVSGMSVNKIDIACKFEYRCVHYGRQTINEEVNVLIEEFKVIIEKIRQNLSGKYSRRR